MAYKIGVNSIFGGAMYKRLIKLSESQHLFLFGARGTGKSTLLKATLSPDTTLFLDLLSAGLEARLARNPDSLREIVEALPEKITTVVIDEVQKVPRVLDVVHSLIEEKKKRFILTGSSARKLKRGNANLLAGRAFVYHLYPFSYLEVGGQFNLVEALQFGQLPKLSELSADEDKSEFLHAYAHTYLKEEVFAEQLVKLLDPFRRFLEVAAQANGKIVNVANIARDVGVDDKTVKSYFSILEDTLIGFMLEPFNHSFRKRLSQKPKFYFFDTGVARALAFTHTIPLAPKTSAYGDAFEHFIILESIKLSSYSRLGYRFSYLHTKDDAEIDLIVERPGKPLLCIEIKSAEQVNQEDIRTLATLCKDLPNSEAICLSNDPLRRKLGEITVYPWHEGLREFFMR
jgi:predicted AAA+ superfamily ATPase